MRDYRFYRKDTLKVFDETFFFYLIFLCNFSQGYRFINDLFILYFCIIMFIRCERLFTYVPRCILMRCLCGGRRAMTEMKESKYRIGRRYKRVFETKEAATVSRLRVHTIQMHMTYLYVFQYVCAVGIKTARTEPALNRRRTRPGIEGRAPRRQQ